MANKIWIFLTVSAIALRMAMLPFFEQPFDIGILLNEIPPTFQDFSGLYVNSPMIRPGNPIFPPMFYIYHGSILFLFPSKVYFISALGLLNIVVDLAMGALIYNYIVKDKNTEKNRALLIYAFWLFSPIVLFTSAVWKLPDSLTAMLTVAAFLALEDNKIVRSGIFLSLATLFKLYPIIFFPIFLIEVYRRASRKLVSLTHWIFAFIFTFVVVSAPFLWRGFNSFVYRVFWLNLTRSGYGTSKGIDGINFLFFMRVYYSSGHFEFAQSLEFLVTVANYGKLFLTGFICLLFLLKRLSFMRATLAAWATYFSFSTITNEQFFVLPLAFLLLDFAENKLSTGKVYAVLNAIWLVFEELRMGLDSAYIYGSRVYQYNVALTWVDRNFYGLLLDWYAQVTVLSILGVLMSTFLMYITFKLIGLKSLVRLTVMWLSKKLSPFKPEFIKIALRRKSQNF